jgi:transcriptional regulator with XRE-family HTH domain
MRTAKNWTQKELATEAGCSRATIAAIELGYEKEPSASMLTNIARALETTTEALLEGRAGNNNKELRDPTNILRDLKDLFDAMPIRIDIFAEDGTEIDHTYWTKSKIFSTTGENNILALVVEASSLEPEVRRGDVLFADTEVAPADGDIVICQHKGDGRLAPCRYRQNHAGEGRIEVHDGEASLRDWAMRGVVMEVNRALKDYDQVKTRTQYEKYFEQFMEYENQLLEHAADMVREYTSEEKCKEFEDRMKKSVRAYQDTMRKYTRPFKLFDK